MNNFIKKLEVFWPSPGNMVVLKIGEYQESYFCLLSRKSESVSQDVFSQLSLLFPTLCSSFHLDWSPYKAWPSIFINKCSVWQLSFRAIKITHEISFQCWLFCALILFFNDRKNPCCFWFLVYFISSVSKLDPVFMCSFRRIVILVLLTLERVP